MRFLNRLAAFGLERSFSALNILLSSVLVARLLSTEAAATYFFAAAVCQLLVSPWTPAAEMRWAGNFSEPRAKTANAVVYAFTGCLLSSIGACAVIALYIGHIGGSWLLLALNLISSIIYAAVIFLIPTKFSNTPKYVVVVMRGAAFGLAVKLTAIVFASNEAVVALAIFSDSFAITVNALAVIRREDLVALRHERVKFKLRGFSPFMAPLFAVTCVLISQKLVLALAGATLPIEAYATFGLAFQVVNSASFISVALTNAVISTIRSNGNNHGALLLAGKYGFAAILAIFCAGILCFYLLGHPILRALFADRGDGVFSAVWAILPAGGAVLLSGMGIAIATVINRTGTYGLACLVCATLSSLCFGIFDVPHLQLLSWALTQLAISLLACLVLWCLALKYFGKRN